MYSRALNLEPVLKRKSLFLLGPRQTGKSTYLKKNYPNALYIDLLDNREFLSLRRNPSLLREKIDYYLKKSKNFLVIIDEIQKIPELLNEVHLLIEQNKKLRFILTGSSARKLKHGGANLLGGRASWVHFYGLVFSEIVKSKKNWPQKCITGSLPFVFDSKKPWQDLADCVGLYLREEIQAESLTRNLDNFFSFLETSALSNAEQINFSNIASDTGVKLSTVRSYYQILSDTLIGDLLPAFEKTKKRKAMTTAKFYFFDCGVTNYLLGRKDLAEGTPEYGKALEQAIYTEIKAYISYNQLDYKFEYWRSTSLFEVDFLLYNSLKNIIAIEIKAGTNPSKKDYKGFLALEEDFPLKRKIVVCRAPSPRLTNDDIEILPVHLFLEELWEGKII